MPLDEGDILNKLDAGTLDQDKSVVCNKCGTKWASRAEFEKALDHSCDLVPDIHEIPG